MSVQRDPEQGPASEAAPGQAESGPRCVNCGEPAARLLAEPDVWLCQACSDATGRRFLRNPP